MERRQRCPSCGEPALLEDEYALAEVVGKGGMGRTYRAERESDGAVVAVKELPVHQLDDVKAMELFEREASVLRQLDHPGVPDYLDHFSAGEGRSLAMYLVQEFIDGETLAEALDQWRPDADEVLGLMVEVLEIFDYLHGLEPPVVHRDVKPDNLMRRADSGEVVLVDFGSVREALEPDEQGGSTVAGTFGFMAPEQFMGRASPATDIYGLAATAVALLARTEPRELMNHDRKLEWKSAVDVDSAFEAALDDMLETDPEARRADAADLAERLRAVRRGEASTPAPAPTSTDLTPPIEIGAPPRDIPDDFLEEFGPSARTNLIIGTVFSFLGGGAGLGVMIFVFAEGAAAGALAIGLFLLLFGGVGAFALQKGVRRWHMLRDVYTEGERTSGEVVRTRFANYSVNGEKPVRIHYRFDAGGATYTGWGDSFEHVGRDIDDTTSLDILYDAEDPDRNFPLI